MMPRLDGKELVKAIRSHDQIRNTPVILVSARAGEEERSDGIAAGADDYLVKPFSGKELLSRIAARLDLSRERTKTAQREQELREAAERANAAKDHFLAELRTPLTPVLMLAEAAESDLNLPASVRADMGLIAQNVRLEVELLSDLLDITRIRQKKLILRHERLNLHELLQRTLALFRHQLLEKKIALHLNTNAASHTVVGDATRLQQVFWNLIGNAVKFTPQGGELSITSECDAERIRVKVQDSGIGIEPAALPRVFDAFEQGTSGVRFGGVGLGLSIAKTLVVMHNGIITAFSAGRDRGALFVVSLPLDTGADGSASTTSSKQSPTVQIYSRPTSFPGLRVLIVEDNRTSLLVLARILERLGCKVSTAQSVTEARAALTVGREYDVLICDIGLPDGSGHDIVKMAGVAQPTLRGALALSGFGTEEDIQKSINAGFVRHLTKPVRLRELQEAIEELPIKDILQY